MPKEELKKTGDKSVCPTAVVVRKGKILMGYRNYTPDKWKKISVWTTPGGRCDDGEEIETALRREVEEETGITDLSILEFIGDAPGAKEGDKVPLFFCTTEQNAQLIEPEKFSEWQWINLEEYFKGSPYNTMNPSAYKMITTFLSERLDIGTL